MPLKTPDFWYRSAQQPPAILEKLLFPLSCLYAFGHKQCQKSRQPYRAAAPVICIGNIVAGGSGKTPSALAVMSLIQGRKLAKSPYFLTRGYGHDEDVLLSRAAPTVVNADRAQGAREAITRGADILVMDDGLQNPGLHKDLSFIVIDGQMGFGNGKLIPAGPLREPLHNGLERADAFILIGEDTRGVRTVLPPGKPVFSASLKATEAPPKDVRYIAFAGLGYPQKFFNFLRQDMGLDVVDTVSFPDHYPYNAPDIAELAHKAGKAEATLITTEKDMQRLPDSEHKGNIVTLPVILNWTNEGDLVNFIKNKLLL
jgi:tetraacyldisaccharide 4'-kinase